jgi:hypothetical protein
MCDDILSNTPTNKTKIPLTQPESVNRMMETIETFDQKPAGYYHIGNAKELFDQILKLNYSTIGFLLSRLYRRIDFRVLIRWELNDILTKEQITKLTIIAFPLGKYHVGVEKSCRRFYLNHLVFSYILANDNNPIPPTRNVYNPNRYHFIIKEDILKKYQPYSSDEALDAYSIFREKGDLFWDNISLIWSTRTLICYLVMAMMYNESKEKILKLLDICNSKLPLDP